MQRDLGPGETVYLQLSTFFGLRYVLQLHFIFQTHTWTPKYHLNHEREVKCSTDFISTGSKCSWTGSAFAFVALGLWLGER